MTRKIFSVLLAVMMLVSMTAMLTLTGCGNTGGVPLTGEVINVYNWGEYIANGDDGTLDVIAEFTKQTGIEVNYTTYASNEEMYAKISSGAADYDVIIPSDYMIEKMISEDMLAELDFDNIPNYEYIDEQYLSKGYDPDNKYTVPYTWGVVGVFYNKTMVDEADIAKQSWDILWDEKYAGNILMFDNQRDAFGIALMKLGYSLNSTDPDEWEEAYELLAEQKPLVQAYVMDQIFDKMANGEAALAPYYAGDARIMMEENEDIGFFIPKEGTNLFFDSMCILKDSAHKEAAEKFINFMCETEIALENIEYICYSTPHSEAYELLDPEIKDNPSFYPEKSILSKCEVFTDLPRDIHELMNQYWVDLKTQN